MAHPFPDLQEYPQSGLSFAWAEKGSSDFHLSPDGTQAGMTMLIRWTSLQTAVQEILGYTWRDTTKPVSRLRRELPWQHPYFNQLFAKAITRIVGIRSQGNSSADPEFFDIMPGEGGVGLGNFINIGPWSNFNLAELTVQFWRPPYYVRSDTDILDANGNPQEWLRYLDNRWEVSTQMLSRGGAVFEWRQNTSPVFPGFPGSVGQKLAHAKLTKRWYQIPQAAIFDTLVDLTPNGLPTRLVKTTTSVVNPITANIGSGGNYTYYAGNPIVGCVNAPNDATNYVYQAGVTNGNAVITGISSTASLQVGWSVYGTGWSDATIVSIDSGTQVTASANTLSATGTRTVMFENPAQRFFGCPTGTLLLTGIELIPIPLQLPPYLMDIPTFSNNEAISQQQYDVVFHFDYFNPPVGVSETFRGHNLMPWNGNSLWYSVRSQKDIYNAENGPYTTPFDFVTFNDLFKIR